MAVADRKASRTTRAAAPTPRKPKGGKASASAGSTTPSRRARGGDKSWKLRLYVAGQTPKSLAAFANLKQLCEKHMPGRYQIDVVDLMANPQLAAGDQIVAVPTLVRRLPEPLKRIIGSLSDEQKFLVGMDLRQS